MPNQTNPLPSWEQYGFHAMSELERMARIVQEISDKVDEIGRKQETAAAASAAVSASNSKTFGSIWGLVAGCIPVTIKVLWDSFHK